LTELSLCVDFVPEHYVAEAILEEIGDVSGQNILLPRADIARQTLAEGLRAKGAQVDEVTAYRTVAAAPVAESDVRPGDVITFTSSSTVRNFLARYGGEPPAVLAATTIACIGPVTAHTAAEAGLQVDVVAEEHTVDGLLAALIAYKEGRR
jgi:uroporphyrinogen-III synthase